MHHPGDGLPRIRRSSSVGQLETVANELAAQSSANVKPTHMRRRSIDHRRQPIVGQIPTGGLNDLNGVGRYLSSEQFVRVGADPLCPSSTSPPPRPPKSEATVKQFMEGDYYARPAYASSGRDRPVSPVHTAVIATTIPESPPHTTVTSFVDGTPSHRPFHRTATPSVQVDPSSVELEVPGTKTKLVRSLQSLILASSTTLGVVATCNGRINYLMKSVIFPQRYSTFIVSVFIVSVLVPVQLSLFKTKTQHKSNNNHRI